MSEFSIEVWGARGSVPASHPDMSRGGCNTTCLRITIDGATVVLDAGTGIVPLGWQLVERGVTDISLFLTHYHFDHVQGLNFFAPLSDQATRLAIHGGPVVGADTPAQALDALFAPPFCPNRLDTHPATVTLHGFADGRPVALPGGATLLPVALNHPGGAYGFRISHGGRIFAFAPDFELGDARGDAALARLVSRADLALLDAMLGAGDIARCRGYGHSHWHDVDRLCARNGVRDWRMMHHAPTRSDAALDAAEAELRASSPHSGAARERDRFVLL